MEVEDTDTWTTQVRQIGCVYASKFTCAWALKHHDTTKKLQYALARMWPISVFKSSIGLERDRD